MEKKVGGNEFGWDGNVNCFKQRKDFTQSYFHWEITSGFFMLEIEKSETLRIE